MKNLKISSILILLLFSTIAMPTNSNAALITSEDFQSEATGWSDNTRAGGGANFTTFLGRHTGSGGSQYLYKTYQLSGTQTQVTINFDFYEIDSWDGETFYVFIDDTIVVADSFNFKSYQDPVNAVSHQEGTVGGYWGWWWNLGFGKWSDQTYTYTLVVNTTASSIKLGFATNLGTGIADESWGIDNVIINDNATSILDGSVGPSGGTVVDAEDTGASFSVDPGVLEEDINVTIDVISDPSVSPPPGFIGPATFYTSFFLAPNPSPLVSPGAMIVLPLAFSLPQGTALSLFRFEPLTGLLTDTGVVGTVDAGGTSATFTGVSHFSTFAAFQVANQPPVAVAGTDGASHVGSIVTLDGSESADPDGNLPLTYEWNIIDKPVGSTTILSASNIVNPQFTLDLPGDYMIELIVTDSLGAASTSDTVIISTTNTVPFADAGPDISITVIGDIVTLDGSQSYDDDGDDITFHWEFLLPLPGGSSTTIIGADTATPTFVADIHGDYALQLIVSDPWAQSLPDTIMVSFENIKPVADAGTSQTIVLGNMASLDGSGSYDANGDYLTYNWKLSSIPFGSQGQITDVSAKTTSFFPDLPGTYTVQLTVNDGHEDSDPSSMQLLAITQETATIGSVQNIESIISSLGVDPGLPIEDILKNSKMQNTLLNKLNAVIENIVAGHVSDALGQLQKDILEKTDGCANLGEPDKNDWVTDCDSQATIYDAVLNAIEMVDELL